MCNQFAFMDSRIVFATVTRYSLVYHTMEDTAVKYYGLLRQSRHGTGFSLLSSSASSSPWSTPPGCLLGRDCTTVAHAIVDRIEACLTPEASGDEDAEHEEAILDALHQVHDLLIETCARLHELDR